MSFAALACTRSRRAREEVLAPDQTGLQYHARSDVGVVDGGELGTSEDGASTVQERDGPGGAFRNVQDVEVPGQFICM